MPWTWLMWFNNTNKLYVRIIIVKFFPEPFEVLWCYIKIIHFFCISQGNMKLVDCTCKIGIDKLTKLFKRTIHVSYRILFTFFMTILFYFTGFCIIVFVLVKFFDVWQIVMSLSFQHFKLHNISWKANLSPCIFMRRIVINLLCSYLWFVFFVLVHK